MFGYRRRSAVSTGRATRSALSRHRKQTTVGMPTRSDQSQNHHHGNQRVEDGAPFVRDRTLIMKQLSIVLVAATISHLPIDARQDTPSWRLDVAQVRDAEARSRFQLNVANVGRQTVRILLDE